METFNMHAAKTHLSKLVQRASSGETIIIANAGRPVARLVPPEAADSTTPTRLGFLAGRMRVPDDFDTMGEERVAALFDGEA